MHVCSAHTQSLPGYCFHLGTIGINLFYEVGKFPLESFGCVDVEERGEMGMKIRAAFLLCLLWKSLFIIFSVPSGGCLVKYNQWFW